jgi:hypothetical protein
MPTYTNSIHVGTDGVVSFRTGIGFSVSTIILWSVLIGGTNNSIDRLELADGQLVIGAFGARPVAGNITSTDGSVTITNGPGTIDLSAPSAGNHFHATAQTFSGEVNTSMQFDLGPTPVIKSYAIEARLTCSSTAAGPSGEAGAFQIFAALRTDGSTAVIISNPEQTKIIEGLIATADVSLTTSSNNLVFSLQGSSGYLLNWTLDMYYTISP